jgi:sodium transport system permease protein
MKRSIAAVLTVAPQGADRRLRDRRTLMTGARLVGAARAARAARRLRLVASLESRAEQREVYVAGAANAPTLQNFLERQTYTVKAPPPDYEAQLRRSRFTDPVVVVPDDFESALARGDAPVVEIVSDSANQRSEAATARIERLLNAFGRERAVLNLALRGVAVQVLEPIRVDERDLANQQTRATRITGMLPYFVMMAVLYGALTAALDTTAGERERGSLEPLLMNPRSAGRSSSASGARSRASAC